MGTRVSCRQRGVGGEAQGGCRAGRAVARSLAGWLAGCGRSGGGRHRARGGGGAGAVRQKGVGGRRRVGAGLEAHRAEGCWVAGWRCCGPAGVPAGAGIRSGGCCVIQVAPPHLHHAIARQHGCKGQRRAVAAAEVHRPAAGRAQRHLKAAVGPAVQQKVKVAVMEECRQLRGEGGRPPPHRRAAGGSWAGRTGRRGHTGGQRARPNANRPPGSARSSV